MEESSGYRQLISQLAEEMRSEEQTHPPPDLLIDYHLGEVGAGEAFEKLQDHIALCPACGQFLDELQNAADAPADMATDTEQKDASWKEVRARLQFPETVRPLPVQADIPPTLLRSLRFSYGIAALFLMTTILSLLSLSKVSQPDVGILPVDLGPLGSLQVREDSRYEEIGLPEGVSAALLILHLERPDRFLSFDIEIRDAQERVRWSKTEASPDGQGFLNLSLPRNFLESGQYRVVLHGRQDDDASMQVDVYLFEWRPE